MLTLLYPLSAFPPYAEYQAKTTREGRAESRSCAHDWAAVHPTGCSGDALGERFTSSLGAGLRHGPPVCGASCAGTMVPRWFQRRLTQADAPG